MTTAVRFDVLIHAPFYGALRSLAPMCARGFGASSIGSAPATGAAGRG